MSYNSVINKHNDHLYIQNSIIVFNFLCTRTDKYSLSYLSIIFEKIIKQIIQKMRTDYFDYIVYLKCLFKMIPYIRDVSFGKGEKLVTYMMICVFYKYYPNIAICLLREIIYKNMGSWADIKYFCHFVYFDTNFSNEEKDKIIYFATGIMLYQLDCDVFFWDKMFQHYLNKLEKNKHQPNRPNANSLISNVAKWVPRKSSKFSWLFEKIVLQWNMIHFPFIFENLRNQDQYNKILNKCKMNFRKMVVKLNKELNTVQIKQCDKKIHDICPENVSLMTMMKQKKSFSKNENHKEYLYNGEPKASFFHKTTHISLDYFVKDAIRLINKPFNSKIASQMAFLNNSWKKNVLMHFKNKNVVNILPIVDVSLINTQTLYSSIGLGIAISQISKLNRIILVENHFEIIKVLQNSDFIDIIRELYPFINNNIELNITKLNNYLTNASSLIKEHIYYVFLSNNENIINNINQLSFIHPCSSMIFWNVFTTLNNDNIDNYIRLFGEKNAIFLSGCSPTLLYSLNENILKSQTSFYFLNETVNLSRYSSFDDIFIKYFII